MGEEQAAEVKTHMAARVEEREMVRKGGTSKGNS